MSGKTWLKFHLSLSGRDTLTMLEVLNSILSKVHTSHPFSNSDLTPYFPPNQSNRKIGTIVKTDL